MKKEILTNDECISLFSLCAFNEHSFIYIYNGILVQISIEDYSILFRSKGGMFYGDYGGIIPIKGGNILRLRMINGYPLLNHIL